MTTLVENTFTNDESTIRIRSFVDSDESVWSNAGDIARACGYMSGPRAIAAAACKGTAETRKEAGELYVSRATALQIATRKGYHRFLSWLIASLERMERAPPKNDDDDGDGAPEAPEQPPETVALQTQAADDAAMGNVLAGTDAVMGRIMDSVAKQIELQAMAASCKALRDSGLPYEMQKDLQRKLADKIVEMTDPWA